MADRSGRRPLGWRPSSKPPITKGMIRLPAVVLAALTLLALGPAPPAILGFTTAGGARERFDEARFIDLPSAHGALDHAAAIGARPHYAGTRADHALALYTAERLREYGFDTRIE